MTKFPALETHSRRDRDGETFTVTTGSGNVFADLGLPDADELLYKSQLAIAAGPVKGRAGRLKPAVLWTG